MDEWAQDSHLYQTMLTRARFANAPIDALVWYQGESDGMLSVDADGFLDKLVDLTTRIRRDLNQPDLLILVVNIWASLERCPLRDDIRYAIAQLPFLVRNVYVVDAQHSTLLDDNIHLTSQSQHRIAALLARTFITTQ
ncbi:hypothetical protein BASA81_005419 [Batrachochytrium salamandrivorans]|nr:hypothetical protein BASA81_005419 [Batrachochytrium salamandrivorans]